MLTELAVRNLGVIDDLVVALGPGMTALTGETGAGKTLLVDALELVLGGRADVVLVRPGAAEAEVAARFVTGDEERVLARVLPATGRSRAYVDGRMATASALAEAGAGLADLHGQHSHQSLLGVALQRAALDRFGAVDLAPLAAARARRHQVEQQLAALGGDARARAREIDLLRFQVDELRAAAITDVDEEMHLASQEESLADAVSHREAAALAGEALAGDGGAADVLAGAISALAGRAPFAGIESQLRAVHVELSETARELRSISETINEDPEALERVRGRRRLLHDLRRKYGATLAEVVEFGEEAARRLDDLESHDERAAVLEAELVGVDRETASAAAAVRRARLEAAPRLAEAVQQELRRLALPRARFEVEVGDVDPGDDVRFLLGANPGESALPLTKIASGGELARTMLALRLVLIEAPETLVFDEVDAGVGGQAAVAVGRALADLGRRHQVLVVTHLPQVAAFADHQIAVSKVVQGGRTLTRAELLDEGGRVIELSRMLSGQPESVTARGHAEELLASAARERSR
jgi:DNA repair protein RecN (Recombination protein N)